jgi:hypothetical protein
MYQGASMSTVDLPPWPDTATFIGLPNETQYGDQWLYERARAEAAIARLRKAVEVLRVVGQYIDVLPGTIQADFFDGCPDVEEALSLIGELPKERT